MKPLPVGHAEICKAVNDTPALQSLLYDLDLLPEQTADDPKRWFYTVTAANHFIGYGDAVRAEERERCARIAADMDFSPDGAIAAAIRKGET